MILQYICRGQRCRNFPYLIPSSTSHTYLHCTCDIFVLNIIHSYFYRICNVFVKFFVSYFYWICNVFAEVKGVGMFPISSLHSLIVRGLIGNVLQCHYKFQALLWHSMLSMFWRKKCSVPEQKKIVYLYWVLIETSRKKLRTKYSTGKKHSVTKDNRLIFFLFTLFL